MIYITLIDNRRFSVKAKRMSKPSYALLSPTGPTPCLKRGDTHICKCMTCTFVILGVSLEISFHNRILLDRATTWVVRLCSGIKIYSLLVCTRESTPWVTKRKQSASSPCLPGSNYTCSPGIEPLVGTMGELMEASNALLKGDSDDASEQGQAFL